MEFVDEWKGTPDSSQSLSFSPDCHRLAFPANASTIQIAEHIGGRGGPSTELHILNNGTFHSFQLSYSWHCAWSPDGMKLFAAVFAKDFYQPEFAWVWDATTYALLHTINLKPPADVDYPSLLFEPSPLPPLGCHSSLSSDPSPFDNSIWDPSGAFFSLDYHSSLSFGPSPLVNSIWDSSGAFFPLGCQEGDCDAVSWPMHGPSTPRPFPFQTPIPTLDTLCWDGLTKVESPLSVTQMYGTGSVPCFEGFPSPSTLCDTLSDQCTPQHSAARTSSAIVSHWMESSAIRSEDSIWGPSGVGRVPSDGVLGSFGYQCLLEGSQLQGDRVAAVLGESAETGRPYTWGCQSDIGDIHIYPLSLVPFPLDPFPPALPPPARAECNPRRSRHVPTKVRR